MMQEHQTVSNSPEVPVDADLVDCVNAGQLTHSEAALYSTCRKVTKLNDEIQCLKKKLDELCTPTNVKTPTSPISLRPV